METVNDLSAEYELRFAPYIAYREQVWKVLLKSFFQRLVPVDGTVLDLGSGWGEFIRNVNARRRIALDLNPDAPQRVGGSVETLVHDCAKVWPLESSSVDVVFTSNFFEHLPDKDALRRTILEAHRCLKPDGRLICLGPNIRYLPGDYWDFWDHYVPLTERSLVEILRLSGFGIERTIGRFLPYSMSQGFTPPIVLVKMYLYCPFLWPFFGKQFLVIARKGTTQG
jgi:SAM-dependent methyltransferase